VKCCLCRVRLLLIERFYHLCADDIRLPVPRSVPGDLPDVHGPVTVDQETALSL